MAGLSSHREEEQAAASGLLNHPRTRILKIVLHGESSCLTPLLIQGACWCTLDECLKMASAA